MSYLARTLAARLHSGQTDEQGQPYIDHLKAVVAILLDRWPDAPAYAVEAAWLHDAIEDTGATEASLASSGIGWEAIGLVRILTRPRETPYQCWIASLALSDNLWAIRIKLADNAHNSAPGRAIPEMTDRRYAPARVVLEAAEERLWETGSRWR